MWLILMSSSFSPSLYRLMKYATRPNISLGELYCLKSFPMATTFLRSSMMLSILSRSFSSLPILSSLIFAILIVSFSSKPQEVQAATKFSSDFRCGDVVLVKASGKDGLMIGWVEKGGYITGTHNTRVGPWNTIPVYHVRMRDMSILTFTASELTKRKVGYKAGYTPSGR